MMRRGVTGFAIVAGALAIGAMVAPAGCLFPDYTFDKGEGGAGAGSGPGGNGSGAGRSEDCTNGIDDNHDGLVDCEDPLCGNHVCVNDVPEGWEGYFALYDGKPADDPGCPAEFPGDKTAPFLGNRGFQVESAECTCKCGEPQDEVCHSPTEYTVFDEPCGSAPNCGFTFDLPEDWNGDCTGNSFIGGLGCGAGSECDPDIPTGDPCGVSVRVPKATVSGGSCTSEGLQKHLVDPTWSTLGRGCGDVALSGKGCGGSQTCLPRPADPFVGGICVSHPGDIACPPGQFTDRLVYYSTYGDTRDCMGICGCKDPTGSTCTVTLTITSDLTVGVCATDVVEVESGKCANVPIPNPAEPPDISSPTATIGTPSGGECPPDDSDVTSVGEAAPDAATATTFCCVPGQ